MKSYGFTNCNDTFSASFSYDPILCTMNFYLTPSVHGRNLLVCMTIIKMKPLRICFVPLVFPYFALNFYLLPSWVNWFVGRYESF